MEGTVNKTISAASQALNRIDEKLSTPPSPDIPRNRRLYADALRAADEAFEANNVVRAANLYNRLLETYPDFHRNDHARFRSGECYVRQERPRWRDALAQYLIVMQQFPAGPYAAPAHIRAAHCFSQVGSYLSARKVLLKLLVEEDLYRPEAAAVLSEARYRLGQYYALEARVAKEREYGPAPQEAN